MNKDIILYAYTMNKAATTGAEVTKGLVQGIRDIGKGIVGMGTKGLLIAPPAAGLIAGHLVSQATSPTGEDRAEAQKALEEQTLLQFKADIERHKKIREFTQKLKRKAERKKEREIRI